MFNGHSILRERTRRYIDYGILDFEVPAKCGSRPFEEFAGIGPLPSAPVNFVSRIVGGRNSEPGGQPWQVSLKRGSAHFCGGTIIDTRWVLTAAHCIPPRDRNFEKTLSVVVGEYDMETSDDEEQTLRVSRVIVHPKFRPLNPVNNDVALLELTKDIVYGVMVQPACLPYQDEEFIAGTLCTVSGWGKMQEEGQMPSILQEVSLPLLDPELCARVLAGMHLPAMDRTMLCAGFPNGGRDACQGDSGGPLVCQRPSGAWSLHGVVSWGVGCARGWAGGAGGAGGGPGGRDATRQGTPGIFARVANFLPWIQQHMDGGSRGRSNLGNCNATGVVLTGESGTLAYPVPDNTTYPDNTFCVWTVQVPAGKSIVLTFTRFDLEPHVSCELDHLAVYTDIDVYSGRFCGTSLPVPIVIHSNQTTLKFVSDKSTGGRGFSLHFAAVDPSSLSFSGCGSLAVLRREGELQSLNYPRGGRPAATPGGVTCRWLLHAPRGKRLQLRFTDFELASSPNCTYDYVAVYGDVERTLQLAKLCGAGLPPPVLSPGETMSVVFASDHESSLRGFKATFSFLAPEEASAAASAEASVDSASPTPPLPTLRPVPLESCGVAPVSPHASARVLGGEEVRPHSWPWTASLRLLGDHACGAVLVHPQWLLTAAHCFRNVRYPLYWEALLGDHDRTQQEPTEQVCEGGGTAYAQSYKNDRHLAPKLALCFVCFKILYRTHPRPSSPIILLYFPAPPTRRVSLVLCHERYNETTADYDVALVRLVSPAQLGDAVRLACLPEAARDVAPSSVCVVTGWGALVQDGEPAERLQQLQVPVLDSALCEREHYPRHPGGISARMLCAGFPSTSNKDTCQGDSGGPLVCSLTNGSMAVFGLTSWGEDCGKQGRPGVYTRVASLLPWIQAVLSPPPMAPAPALVRKYKAGRPHKMAWDCSGVAQVAVAPSTEGQLSSPGYPDSYPGGRNCSWLLRVGPDPTPEVGTVFPPHSVAPPTVARGTALQLVLEDLSLYNSTGCAQEALELYDGNSLAAPLLGRFCGLLPRPLLLRSSGPRVLLHFRSGPLPLSSNRGFAIKYLAVQMPGPPVQLLDGMVPPSPTSNSTLVVSASHGPAAPTSSVAPTSPPVSPIPPRRPPPLYHRPSEVAASPQCGDLVLEQPAGTISSPAFPWPYPPHVRCSWRVVAPNSALIRLDFASFSTRVTSAGDCTDSLSVYELNATADTRSLVAHLCGRTLPPPLKTGHDIALEFVAGGPGKPGELRGFADDLGFNLTYTFQEPIAELPTVPSGSPSAPGETGCLALEVVRAGAAGGFVSSPAYPQAYGAGLQCTWTLYSVSGAPLRVHVLDVDLETSPGCTWDALSLHDGPDVRAPLLGLFCSQSPPTSVVSSGPLLTVTFHSDSALGGRGFRLRFEAGDALEALPSVPPGTGPAPPAPVLLGRAAAGGGRRLLGATASCGAPVIRGLHGTAAAAGSARVLVDPQLGLSRVVGGTEAAQRAWPWQGSVQYGQGGHYCGATLIHPHWAITAAHCDVSAASDTLVLGLNDLRERGGDGQRLQVARVVTHPGYGGMPPQNDLALLQLATPAHIGPSVMAVCLPKAGEVFEEGKMCVTTGWGSTDPFDEVYPDQLQQATLPLIGNEECRKRWGLEAVVTAENVCAGAAGASSCLGDSGGPLVCHRGGLHVLVGVVSWGSETCQPNVPSVYTNIASHTAWIAEMTGGVV
ncbi:ovochymase-2-like [Lampetra fluviatilis]